MIIDVFCHILPPRYLQERNRRAGAALWSQYARYPEAAIALTDLDARFRVMDRYPDVRQMLTIAGPNIESITSPRDALELAMIANDELAALVARHPDRFIAAAACLPMSDPGAAVAEATRAIDELGFRGIEVFTDINGKPLDREEFLPIFELMTRRDLPVLLHPRGTNTTPNYADEDASKFLIYTNFGWPFATSMAMARLAFGGVLERFPALKVVTHHAGGLVPFFAKRIEMAWDFNEQRMGYRRDGERLPQSPLTYYRMFYCDTAIQGNTAALMCAYEFFGADHMVFATDSPYDSQCGELLYRDTIRGVEGMPIGETNRQKIFELNARRLFRIDA